MAEQLAPHAESHPGHLGSAITWSLPHEADRPPVTEALPVAEAVHTGVLSLAGRHFGADAIPSVISGRAADGRPLTGTGQHGHKHVLVGSEDGHRIDRVVLWAPQSFSNEERASVASLRLRYRGRSIPLRPGDDGRTHPAFSTATAWRTLTPYMPFNFVKPRGRNSVEGQVTRELVDFRGFPAPAAIWVRPWTGADVVTRRQRGPTRSKPFGLELRFAEPVRGPIALGGLAHFALGLLVPVH